jgi:ABC-type glycerol-3-phosphate transport system substrate-binding protein
MPDKENVGVTAVPHGPHGLAAEPIIYGFGISRGTAHPEAAWQLLHFLSRQPPQDVAMFSVGPVPARRSVAAANSYWEQLPDSLAPACNTRPKTTPPSHPYQAVDLLQEALVAYIDDDMPVPHHESSTVCWLTSSMNPTPTYESVLWR